MATDADIVNSKGYQDRMRVHDANLNIAETYFKECGLIVRKVDAKSAMEQGISFNLCKKEEGKKPLWVSVSVKVDFWANKSDNIAIEYKLNRAKTTFRQPVKEDGFFFTLGADKLCVIDKEGGRLFIFDWPTLKKFVSDNMDNELICQRKEAANKFDGGTAINYLIPIHVLWERNLIEAYREFTIKE